MDGGERPFRLSPEGEETASLGGRKDARDPEGLLGTAQAECQVDRPGALAQSKLKDSQEIAGQITGEPAQPLRPVRPEERGTQVTLEDGEPIATARWQGRLAAAFGRWRGSGSVAPVTACCLLKLVIRQLPVARQ